jgi:class 3 adenylate cyclase/trans-aconitate methyltransferase
VRNFTLLLDNYGEDDITEMLDHLFAQVHEIVAAHDGQIDKVVGDGLMAVFRGETPSQNALETAAQIHHQTTTEVESELPVGTINVGIGIATGVVNETTLAEIDSTVIGRCVNIAARLEGLCKEYDVSILIDDETYHSGSLSKLPNDYIGRRIPDQNLRGIRQSLDVYHLCNTRKFSEEYISMFNDGVSEYVNQNYEQALNFFTQAYTQDERYTDQALLNHFTNSCLEKINDSQPLFRNPDRYEEHSTIQEQQSIKLAGILDSETLTREFDPEYILDVGCGTGKVTERMAAKYPTAKIRGIDSSRSAIAKARTTHNPEQYDIEYEQHRIEKYCPSDEVGQYDLIFSNTTMHWVEDQHGAYGNLRQLIADDGVLAIHQGHKGSYKELHEVAVDVVNDFGYHRYFDNLNPPLDLIYYTREEMESLLDQHGFDNITITVDEDTAPETIIDDFAEASLNAYCERLESESQREIFREQFKLRAQEQLDPEDITVHRLYVIAEPDTA